MRARPTVYTAGWFTSVGTSCSRRRSRLSDPGERCSARPTESLRPIRNRRTATSGVVRLIFLADLKPAAVPTMLGVAGTLASVKLTVPDKAEVYASGIDDFQVYAGGTIVGYTN